MMTSSLSLKMRKSVAFAQGRKKKKKAAVDLSITVPITRDEIRYVFKINTGGEETHSVWVLVLLGHYSCGGEAGFRWVFLLSECVCVCVCVCLCICVCV